MLLHSNMDVEHLTQMLVQALTKEEQQWTKQVSSTEDISGAQFDEETRWLASLNGKFHFMPETFNLSVSILIRFLHLVKVRAKYLHCVSVSCFYIAAKSLEEDELIPSTVDLVRQTGCGCSVAEVLRMEAVILNKLDWNPMQVTATHFLHIIHALLLRYQPHLLANQIRMSLSGHMTLLTRKLLSCLCRRDLWSFRPVTLVLALLSLEVEQITLAWLPVVVLLQKMTKVNNQELIACREVVALHLESLGQRVTPYKFRAEQAERNKSKKRKVSTSSLDDPEQFYDGFKRLYSEDDVGWRGATCAAETSSTVEPLAHLVPPICTN